MKKFLFLFLFFALVQVSAFTQGPFIISASSFTGGTISPSGAVSVAQNTNQTFTITAKSGFLIGNVNVDGVSVGAVATYTFTNVTAVHTISVTFTVGPHLALNKPASAENTEIGNSPAYANDADGSNNNFWSGSPYPKWWKVDLQGFFDLTSIVIRNYVDGARFYHYNIESSNDDITYTQIAAKTNDNVATDDGDTYPLTASARYLRVNMVFNSANSGTHICDFRVYGTPNPNTNTITASAGTGGTISPLGAEMVLKNTNKTFTITPNSGYIISDVLVDGGSVGAVGTYTFTNIISNHTISATFLSTTRTITVTQGTGGTITPQGSVIVNLNANQTFNIAAKSGFQISDVKVDGVSAGAVSTYTFNNVIIDHTITATFTVTAHLALNKPAFAEDSEAGILPSYANDNNGSNLSYWTGTQYPKWWKVDLGDNYSITSIVIRNYFDGIRFYHYNIEASNDDVTYTKIAEKTNDNLATDDGDTYNLTASARYLRVNVLSNSLNPGTHISDFRVYGTKALTISNVTANNKVYDGNTTAVLNTGSAVLAGVAGGDNVTLISTGATGTFIDKNVGTNKTVSTSGFTLGGTDAAKYTLIQPSATANITTKALTIGGTFGAGNKIYDGTTSATITSNSLTLLTKAGSDDVTLTAVAAFADKVVGAAKPVSLTGSSISGTDAANYTLSFAGAPASTANITAKVLTVGGTFTAGNKVYDGTTSAVIVTNSLTLLTKAGTDNVSLTAVAVFNSKVVGTGKTVTLTGSTLSGTDATNYTLSLAGAPAATGDITVNVLTIGGTFTVNNKVYDGLTSATISANGLTLLTKAGSDDVSLTAVAAFTSKVVGTGKPVSLTGSSLSGADAANYSLSLAGAPITTGDITAKVLTVGGTFTVSNKVYDGTTTAVISTNSLTLLTKAGGDDVTLSALAVFADKIVGTGKPVSLTGSSLAGIDAANYTLSFTGAPTATANITAKVLTIGGTFAAGNKVYDGTTSAVITSNSLTLLTKAGSDDVSLTAVAVFNSKVVGTGKTVTLTGSTLGGTDGTNYTLSLTGAPTTNGNITAKPLTIGGTFTANNKVYDATTSATLLANSLTLLTKAGSDDVSLTAVAAFADKIVGTGKSVSLTGSSLAGIDATNYTLSFTGAPTATANITSRVLTIGGTFATGNKVYDGTTSATISTNSLTLLTKAGSDNVTLTAVAVFSDNSVGTGKPVSLTGSSLAGTDATNYTLSFTGAPTSSANITAKVLTIGGTFAADNKVYDGTTSANISTNNLTLLTKEGTDDVSLTAVAVFADINVGTGKTVNLTGSSLAGTDAPNYILSLAGAPVTTANITSSALTVTGITANNKVYDGTTAATLNSGSASLVGVLATDVVTLNLTGVTGTFINKNVGSAKTVLITGITLSGADAEKYILVQPESTADITLAGVTITGVTARDKVYNGTTSAALNTGNATLAGVFVNDVVAITSSGATGTFADKNVGSGKPVTISGFALEGADADNYSLTQPTTTGNITPAGLTISGVTANNKVYDGTTTAVLNTGNTSLVGVYGADAVTITSSAATGIFANKNAGTGKAVATNGFSIGGVDAGNYTLTQPSLIANISPKALTITANNVVTTYRAAVIPALTVTYSGFVSGEDKSVLDVLPVAVTSATTSSDAGTYDINVSGAVDGNYSFIYNKGILIINKADQTITFDDIPADLRMTQDYQLNATAASGLPVSFETSDQNIGSVNGNVLTINKDGNLTITAMQEGDHNWNPANDVTQTIVTLPTFDNIMSLFTPNNDGINDFWYIPDLEQYGDLKVTVYNRFGQIVYQSDGYKNDWDGTWNGYSLPSASYYYIIKSSTKGFIKGVVNIVR